MLTQSDSPQLPLKLKQTFNKTFHEFIVGDNSSLINSLHSFVQTSGNIFYLWGASGTGKTHILQALINDLRVNGKSIGIIPYADITQRENVSLISMFDIVCIDNAENIVANNLLEEALFLWINEVKQAGKKIIIAAQVSNKSQAWQLPDLISRLQSGQTHELKPLTRKQSLQVFKQLAKAQGIEIDNSIENYLQNNCSMNMKFLANLLIQIDDATLVQKKPVTIPLLKKIIAYKSC
ncbi:MAG: DnaA/Hda family protein [Proteobacteria bacterium]|nr:DnaA/Hda family protein [Pseudomonadota bacterium]